MLRICKEKTLTVGTSAQKVDVGYRGFIIKNASEADVYFHAFESDNKNAAASKGMKLSPGETFPHVLTCETLSVIASAADADVRIMMVMEG